MGGGLVPVLFAIRFVRVCVSWHKRITFARGTGTRPPPIHTSTPCPYRTGDVSITGFDRSYPPVREAAFPILSYICTQHTIVYGLQQTRFDESVLPVTLGGAGQAFQLDAQVVIGQSFPAAVLDAFDEDCERLACELFAETAHVLVVEGQQALTTGLFDLVLYLSLHTGRRRSLAGREAEDVGFGKL